MRRRHFANGKPASPTDSISTSVPSSGREFDDASSLVDRGPLQGVDLMLTIFLIWTILQR